MSNQDIFDPSEVADEGYASLPDGVYKLAIEKASYEPNKKGTGSLVKITSVVDGDEFSGRRVWLNLNIRHENEKAQTIGRAQFKQLLTALGMGESRFDLNNDLEGLYGRSFMATVKTAEGRTEAKNFKKVDEIPF
jgi:hypothetical protein